MGRVFGVSCTWHWATDYVNVNGPTIHEEWQRTIGGLGYVPEILTVPPLSDSRLTLTTQGNEWIWAL